jgi:2-oxoglutarate dehydrogenase E2 component (dihydrolipoamide succinyltransferase)
MPKMGESIMEATVLKWLKNPGDEVKQDETVLEIATDKVDSEVPSTSEGIIEEILYKVNDVVPVGAVIARIRTAANGNGTAQQQTQQNTHKTEQQPVAGKPEPARQAEKNENETSEAEIAGTINRFYSPLVMNIASSEGISMQELESIQGTGNEGRVTKKDILQFVENKKQGKTSPAGKTTFDTRPEIRPQENKEPAGTGVQRATPPAQPPAVYTGNVEIIEMDRMRRLIADHMVRSKQTSPHVTSFSEADVTNLVLWREKVKTDFEKREGTKITYTHLFVEAVVRCIKKYPLINCSLDGDKIIIKKDINIGLATALPSGNLIVPVIKNADQYNLVGLAKQVNALADSARNNRLKPEETQGGTFTLTNVGTFGSLMGTPIINQPQVAILAVGIIKKRPVVIETAVGDSIAIRHMMYLSMSYDHRIVDGSLGATFLTMVANELENFDPERQY